MEAAKLDAAISCIAHHIAIDIFRADATMARAAIVAGIRRTRRVALTESHREPIDCDSELIRKRAGGSDREVGVRILEIDRERQRRFITHAFCRDILIRSIRRRAMTTSEHPSEARKMLAPEKHFAIDDVSRHAE